MKFCCQRIRWLCSCFLCGAFLFPAHATADQPQQGQAADVYALIQKIESEASDSVRTELTSHLARQLREIPNAHELDMQAVNRIAGLLSDSADSVRYWAALSLGNIGSSARSAVPALIKALKERECVGYPTKAYIQLSLSSADGIRTALERIGSEPPDQDSLCRQ